MKRWRDDSGRPIRARHAKSCDYPFRDELGYRYLGDRSDRSGNSNIEEELLTGYLAGCGYTLEQISVALHRLRTEADNHSRTLYGNNQAVYSLLRYDVPVKTEAGKVTESVRLINWHKPERNDFARAEEVTLGTPPVQPSKSGRLLRNTVELRHLPDFVLYQF